MEIDVQKNAKEVIMHSHSDGEVWGLCPIDNGNDPSQGKYYATCGDDNKILVFDITPRKCVHKGFVVMPAPDESSV